MKLSAFKKKIRDLKARLGRFALNNFILKWYLGRLGVPQDVEVFKIQRRAVHYWKNKETGEALCMDFGREILIPEWLIQIFHFWDIKIANRILPVLNLGFDTGSTNNIDSWLDSDRAIVNYGTSASMTIRRDWGDLGRVVMDWTLSSGWGTITKIELFLHCTTAGTGTHTLNLHELIQPTLMVETEVTWNRWRAGSNWTNPGGDFSSTIVDSLTTSGTGWKVWNLGPGALNPIPGLTWGSRFDILIKGPDTGANYSFVFWTKEYGTVSLRPYILISYIRTENRRFAVISTLERRAIRTAAVTSTLERYAEQTVSIFSTLDGQIRSAAAVISNLERIAKRTLATVSRLERRGYQTLAANSTLAKRVKTTTAVYADLQLFYIDKMATTARLEGQKVKGAAVSASLEETSAETLAAISTLAIEVPIMNVAVSAVLEKSDVSTVAARGDACYESSKTISLFSDLIATRVTVSAVSAELEGHGQQTLALSARLALQNQHSFAVTTDLMPSGSSRVGVLSVLEKPSFGTTAAMCDLNRIVRERITVVAEHTDATYVFGETKKEKAKWGIFTGPPPSR